MDIVVAVYKETLEWLEKLRPMIRTVYVYCRDPYRSVIDLGIPTGITVEYHVLPNYGRESAVYLFHMMRIFDSPEKFRNDTLFTMGLTIAPGQVHPQKWETLLRICHRMFPDLPLENPGAAESSDPYGQTADKLAFFVANYHMNGNPMNVDFHTPRTHPCQPAVMRPYCAWYSAFVEPVCRKSLCNETLQRLKYHAAVFAVSPDQILKYPRAWYEELYRQSQAGVSPEVGHYMERMWKIVFDTL